MLSCTLYSCVRNVTPERAQLERPVWVGLWDCLWVWALLWLVKWFWLLASFAHRVLLSVLHGKQLEFCLHFPLYKKIIVYNSAIDYISQDTWHSLCE